MSDIIKLLAVYAQVQFLNLLTETVYFMLAFISLVTIILSVILIVTKWRVNKNTIFLSLAILLYSIFAFLHHVILFGKNPFWIAVFFNHLSPLNLLTHAEAIERLNGCSCLIEDLLHCLFCIFSKRLLNQRNFLDEACYATFNDLDEGSF